MTAGQSALLNRTFGSRGVLTLAEETLPALVGVSLLPPPRGGGGGEGGQDEHNDLAGLGHVGDEHDDEPLRRATNIKSHIASKPPLKSTPRHLPPAPHTNSQKSVP